MMAKRIRAAKKKLGLKPGSVVYVGKERTEEPQIDVIDYTDSAYDEKRVATAEECFPYRDSATLTWINVEGIHGVEMVEKIGVHFGMHALVMEDIVNTGQRPKAEEFDNYLYVVLKMLRYAEVTYFG